MEALGARCDVIRTHRREPLPSLDGYEGLIVLGGAMNAEDDRNHHYLPGVVALLQEARRRDLPTLGVCLGGQLLARSLGARVWRKPKMEIGYFPVQITDPGRHDPLFRGLEAEFLAFQWHEDAFDLPAGATSLVDSRRDTLQAYRLGNSFGLQFHPEVDPDVVASWISVDGSQLLEAAEPTTPEAVIQRAHDVDDLFAAQTAILCENWMAFVAETTSLHDSGRLPNSSMLVTNKQ
jgi:GMP synthase-like glutamine amidotransferase